MKNYLTPINEQQNHIHGIMPRWLNTEG